METSGSGRHESVPPSVPVTDRVVEPGEPFTQWPGSEPPVRVCLGEPVEHLEWLRDRVASARRVRFREIAQHVDGSGMVVEPVLGDPEQPDVGPLLCGGERSNRTTESTADHQ